MHSFHARRFHSFQADASALGGFLETPFQRPIPTAAAASLPPAGGLATARAAAFNFEDIVSYSSAYTLVTGKAVHGDDTIATQATAVVEDLNILEVVTAKRIVAQLSVISPPDGPKQISLAGTRFEDLRIGGRPVDLVLNERLQRPTSSFDDVDAAGQVQARGLVTAYERRGGDASTWIKTRYGVTQAATGPNRRALCSLVDGVRAPGPLESFGHVVELSGFGRIYLAELLVSRGAVQYVSVRAELGCPVTGMATGPSNNVSGGGAGVDH
jgi:hypothetical protein